MDRKLFFYLVNIIAMLANETRVRIPLLKIILCDLLIEYVAFPSSVVSPGKEPTK